MTYMRVAECPRAQKTAGDAIPTPEETADQFDRLLSIYQSVVELMDGRGAEGQAVVKSAYDKLHNFTKINPEFAEEFRKRIPHMFEVYDDGCGGMLQACYDIQRRRLL